MKCTSISRVSYISLLFLRVELSVRKRTRSDPEVIKDLETCAANCRAHKEKLFDIERKRRALLMNNK